MPTYNLELTLAVSAAQHAGELATRYQSGIEAEEKSDLSPVTRADREAEALITSMIAEAFPEDGILGEEGANRESRNGRRWIIDPIDGTRDYVRGSPCWSTLIGFEVDGEVAAGVASFPRLGLMYSAEVGAGAFCNGQRIRVSAKSELSQAVLCVNGFNRLSRVPFGPRLTGWMDQFWAVRCLGGAPDCMLVAGGQADIWLEIAAAPWDLAPLKIIVEEAGGAFFNFDGGSSIYGGNCFACTPALVPEVKAFLGLA